MSSNHATEPGWSLAGRLAIWYAASTFLLLLAVEGFLFWELQSSLNRDDDGDMAERVSMIRRVLTDRPQDTEMLQSLMQWKSPGTFLEPIFVRVTDSAGHVIAETTGMTDLPEGVFPETGTGGFARRAASGRPFRVMATQKFRGYRIQAAIDYADEESLLAHYRRQVALVSL